MLKKELTISSTYEAIRSADDALHTLLASAGMTEDMTGACELALHELLTNLVDHAYQGAANGEIVIHLCFDAGQLTIETRDRGTPPNVDLTQIAMPDPDELATGGYGLAIIQALMDEVSYRIKNGQNYWQLKKDLKN